MGTKYLARTAIEGGRRAGQRYEEHVWTKSERLRWNRHLRDACLDRDLVYEFEPDNRTEPYYKEFDDKLTPIYSWLQSRVGRPWAAVYAEMKQRFDTRTTAGRHIVYDHLLGEVEGSGQQEEPLRWYGRRDFHIDEDGIFVGTYRKFDNQRPRRRKNNRIRKPPPRKRKWSAMKIGEFFQGRRIYIHDGVPHWTVPDPTGSTHHAPCIGVCHYPFTKHEVVLVTPVAFVGAPRRGWRHRNDPPLSPTRTEQQPYRQLMHCIPRYVNGGPLSDAERKKLNTMISSQWVIYCDRPYA